MVVGITRVAVLDAGTFMLASPEPSMLYITVTGRVWGFVNVTEGEGEF